MLTPNLRLFFLWFMVLPIWLTLCLLIVMTEPFASEKCNDPVGWFWCAYYLLGYLVDVGLLFLYGERFFMLIIGWDPGKILGWCVYDSETDMPVDGQHGEIVYEGRTCRTSADIVLKMRQMWGGRRLRDLWEMGVRWACIEKQFQNMGLLSYQNVLTGCAREAGMGVMPLHNATIKKVFTGSGKADKEDIQTLIRLKFGRQMREHEADAFATAYSGYPAIMEKLGTPTMGRMIIK